MPGDLGQIAVYRIWSGDKLLFTGESMFVFGRAYVNVSKSHWFPLPTHITIEWCDSQEQAAQVKERSVSAEQPLFRHDDGGSYLLTDGRYVNTAELTKKAQSGPVPDGYYRDAEGRLHSKRERGRGRGFVPASAREAEGLRIRVRELEARLAKLDVCITPSCGRKITALAQRMCSRCYSRTYYRDRAQRAAREGRAVTRRLADEALRQDALLAKRPEVYQAWVMRCILEDLEAAPEEVDPLDPGMPLSVPLAGRPSCHRALMRPGTRTP
jgi:hypothetical protein